MDCSKNNLWKPVKSHQILMIGKGLECKYMLKLKKVTKIWARSLLIFLLTLKSEHNIHLGETQGDAFLREFSIQVAYNSRRIVGVKSREAFLCGPIIQSC